MDLELAFRRFNDLFKQKIERCGRRRGVYWRRLVIRWWGAFGLAHSGDPAIPAASRASCFASSRSYVRYVTIFCAAKPPPACSVVTSSQPP